MKGLFVVFGVQYFVLVEPEGKILAVAVEIIVSGKLKVEFDHWLRFFTSIIIGIYNHHEQQHTF